MKLKYEIINIQKLLVLSIILIIFSTCKSSKTQQLKNAYPFQKENLIPWSIVSFDVKERTPEQRIKMLKRLGFNQYAYGNRPKHQSTMKYELELAKQNNVQIKAVWLYINLDKDKVGKLKPHSEAILKTVEAVGLHTQIWVGFAPDYYNNLSDQKSLEQTVKMIEYLSQRAQKMGCKIALYNHGGWFGNSKNQLKIINALPKQDLGIIFNFHHAHAHLNTFQSDIKRMLPYLWCVNLNGMKKEGPKIITIGEGNLEKQMIQELLDLGYNKPFGILGHLKGGDAELILEKNLHGLHMLFPQ